MRKIIIKILQTSGANIYAIALGIITLAITARWLGPEGRGIVATVTTWVTLFVDVTGLSLGVALIYQATQNRDESWLRKTLGNLFLLVGVMTVISWIIIMLIYVAGNYWGLPNLLKDIPLYAIILGFLILPFWYWEKYNSALLNIEDRLNLHNRYQIIGSSTNAISIGILVMLSGFGVAGVLISKLLWQAIIAIGGLNFLLKQTGTRLKTDFVSMKQLVMDGLKLHLNTIGVMLSSTIDIIMVNAYLGAEATGFYQLSIQLVQLMLVVSYASYTVLQGEATRLGVYGVWGFQKKILLMATALVTIGVLIADFTAEWWLILLAGEDFRPTIQLFQYLSILVVTTTITNILSVQWIARGLLWQMSAMTLFKGVLNVSLNALFIPKFGLMGAVYSTLAVIAFGMIIDLSMLVYFELDTRKNLLSGKFDRR